MNENARELYMKIRHHEILINREIFKKRPKQSVVENLTAELFKIIREARGEK